SIRPLEWASAHAALRAGFLDSAADAWVDRNGAVVLHDPTGAAGGDIGAETNFWVELLPEGPWRMRVGYGRFNPGSMPRALGRADAAEVFFLETRALF
ncbi:MAG TPA: hypothetical protein ENN09_05110, partial [Planctomycetes bacterium]|nr:hypothetical protein [Planctomycetota bacterium]